MLYVFIGIFVVYITIKIALRAKRTTDRTKRIPHTDDTEKYIPQSVMQGALKCTKCGASVPLSDDKKLVTMFCPFCGNPLEDAKKLMEQAHQNRAEERNYEVRIRELENQVREQENEKRRIRHNNVDSISDLLISVIPFVVIVGFLYFLYKLIFHN